MVSNGPDYKTNYKELSCRIYKELTKTEGKKSRVGRKTRKEQGLGTWVRPVRTGQGQLHKKTH